MATQIFQPAVKGIDNYSPRQPSSLIGCGCHPYGLPVGMFRKKKGSFAQLWPERGSWEPWRDTGPVLITSCTSCSVDRLFSSSSSLRPVTQRVLFFFFNCCCAASTHVWDKMSMGFDHFSVPAKMRDFFIKMLMAFFKGQHTHTKRKILWLRAVYCLRLRLICVIWSHGCCFRTRCPPLHPEENSSLFPPQPQLGDMRDGAANSQRLAPEAVFLS